MSAVIDDIDLFSDEELDSLAIAPTSLFDSLKLDGQELWSARDLMVAMGYSAWRNFEVPLSRAMQAAENQGYDLTRLFVASRNKSGGGRDYQDWHLTRFAAYLVTMNGDPNKREVAAAQAYFAVKTREAEVAKPQLTGPALMAAALIEANAVIESQTKELEVANEQAAINAPKVGFYDKFVDAGNTKSVGEVAKQLGIGQNKLFDQLRLLGIFIGTGHMRNTPYQRYAHHFQVHPTVVKHNDGSEHISQTTRVRGSGIPFIAKKLGLTLKETT